MSTRRLVIDCVTPALSVALFEGDRDEADRWMLDDHELEQARPAGLSGWADMNQALLHLEGIQH